MTAGQTSRRVYSAEQLCRLRTSSLQAKFRDLIEEQNGEDAQLVKEHVLRGSKSFAARSWKSRPSAHSLQSLLKKENRSTHASDSDRPRSGQHAFPSASVLGEIAPNNQALRAGPDRFRPSPTASLKRKKAEAIVKAHGSPTHVRVTAGGRIVPSEQSPLCHPRYGYSAVKVNGGLIKFAPNHLQGKAQWTPATQNGFVAQDVNGRLCQIVNGTILPLTEIDGALQLFIPAPNLNITQRAASLGAVNDRAESNGRQPQRRQPSRVIPQEPSVTSQINALELEYSKLEHDLKGIDKTEALHGRTMSRAAKDALINRRRELVVDMDKIRKALKSLRQQTPSHAQTSPRAAHNQPSASPPRNRLPPFLEQRQAQKNEMDVSQMPPPIAPAMYGSFYDSAGQLLHYPGHYGFPTTPSPDSTYSAPPWMLPPPFVPPPPFDGSLSSTNLPYQQPFNATVPMEQVPVQHVQPAPQVEKNNANGLQQESDGPLVQSDGARSYTDLRKVSPPRQSHALTIRAPEYKPVKSSLNPMSPPYRPGSGVTENDRQDVLTPAQSVKDRVPPPLSPMHQLRPVTNGPLHIVNATDETVSPTKKNIHMHSSSISSFETADFFPRNTREYSTRKHAYPPSAEQSEDKENMAPQRYDSKADESPVTPDQDELGIGSGQASQMNKTQTGGYEAPTAPPGTPVDPDAAANAGQLPLKLDGLSWERQSHGFDASHMPDRQMHNMSPKNKRHNWLFVEEHPDPYASLSSSPDKLQNCQEELCVTSSPYDRVNFSDKSREWIEGFQAGLGRNSIGADRVGEFLEGYCAGLLSSKPSSIARSNGSPVKSCSSRPSPVPPPQSQSSMSLRIDRQRPMPMRSALAPLEIAQQSMDTLKQAVLAPQNENAILTPVPDGPHVNDSPFNLGSWAKSHNNTTDSDLVDIVKGQQLPGFRFPPRTSSMLKADPQRSSEDRLGPKNEKLKPLHDGDSTHTSERPLLRAQQSGNEQQLQTSPSLYATSLSPSSITNGGSNHRISSITSMESNLYRQYPGHRIFSPHLEWKSASSVAQHGGLAAGFFAHAQFDGTDDTFGTSRWHDATLTAADDIVGPSSQNLAAFAQQRPTRVFNDQTGGAVATTPTQVQAMQRTHGRFKEGSLDGMSSTAARSPESPAKGEQSRSSKIISPAREKMKESPNKGGSSPARAKFEHIAEKVGIKVAPKEKAEKELAGPSAAGEPGSPSGKRRWRDVWRGGAKKETSKDETT